MWMMIQNLGGWLLYREWCEWGRISHYTGCGHISLVNPHWVINGAGFVCMRVYVSSPIRV